MRYFFIDRVLRLQLHDSITALKNVALSEDVFNDHFYANPVMPGALQVEALAQAGTILLEVSSDFTRKALLVLIQQAKFRKIVRPGDQMHIEMHIVSSDDDVVLTEATVTVDGNTVTSARLTFSLKPIDEFYSPDFRHVTTAMYDNFLRGATITGQNRE